MSVGRLLPQGIGAVALACTASACGSSGGGPAPSTVATVGTAGSNTSGTSTAQASPSTVTSTVAGPATSAGQGNADDSNDSGARACGNASGYSVSVVDDASCAYALDLASAVTTGYFAGDDPSDPYPLRAITATSPTKGSVTSQCRMVADGSATCTTPGGSRIVLDR